MEPRRIRRIHSPRSSLHRLTAAASTTRCRRYKTLSVFIPTTTTRCRAAARGQHRDENERPPFSPLPRSMREQGRRQDDCRRKVRRHRYGCPRCSFCRESSTQRSRKRVTFVMRPATPCPVPSKKRQRFNPHPPAEYPPLRPHHKGLPPTIMLSYLFAAEK